MVWFVFLHLLGFVVDLLTTTRRPDRDKDLEILGWPAEFCREERR